MVRPSYTFSNNAETIRRLLKKKPHYQAIADRAAADTAFAIAHFADDPTWVSGWGHDFCCPKCASTMQFDVNMPFNPPNVFTCPHCGATAEGEAYDAAWVYKYRFHYGQLLQSAAVCAVLGDADALAFIIRYMDFYAEHYVGFEVHGKHAGKGKVMEQGLDEAVWTIAVLRSLYACGDLIPEEKKARWLQKMYIPMTELLIPQCRTIHNIPTWMLCAVGMIGMYFGDEKLLDYALNNEVGLRRQIVEGFTADGIWYEGSMTYHYYTVQALTYFFSVYAIDHPGDPLMDTFAKMYTSPQILSHDGYHVPALNDGWYPNTVSSLVALAARICSDPSLTEAVEQIRRNNPRALESVSALLYEMVEEDVTLLAATNLAVVHKPFHAVFKSGVIAASHRHIDYLSLRISPFSDDLGTPGYAHPLTAGWYRIAPSHNLICVDGDQPHDVIKSHVEAVTDGVRGVVDGEWADLTKAQRTLTVDGDTLVDESDFSAETEHTYDWIFHSLGSVQFSCGGEDAPALSDKRGFDCFTDICRMDADSSFTARFTMDGVGTLTLTVPETAGLEIYTAHTPSNPADIKRTAVILRRKAKDASFRVLFSRA